VNPPASRPSKLDDLLEPVNPLEIAHGTAPEAPPAPGTNPLAVAHGTDTVPPGQAFQMPDPIGSGAKGIADAIDELGQSVIARNRGSFDEAANQPPPEDWNIHPEDFLDVTKLTNKLSYGLTHSSPTLGAAALGGIAGSPLGIAGSAVGAGVSAGLAQMLQSLGPHYKAALAQGHRPRRGLRRRGQEFRAGLGLHRGGLRRVRIRAVQELLQGRPVPGLRRAAGHRRRRDGPQGLRGRQVVGRNRPRHRQAGARPRVYDGSAGRTDAHRAAPARGAATSGGSRCGSGRTTAERG
jgi:hypothetical protein